MSLRKLTISFGNTSVLIDFSTSLNDFNCRDIIEMAYIFSVISGNVQYTFYDFFILGTYYILTLFFSDFPEKTERFPLIVTNDAFHKIQYTEYSES